MSVRAATGCRYVTSTRPGIRTNGGMFVALVFASTGAVTLDASRGGGVGGFLEGPTCPGQCLPIVGTMLAARVTSCQQGEWR